MFLLMEKCLCGKKYDEMLLNEALKGEVTNGLFVLVLLLLHAFASTSLPRPSLAIIVIWSLLSL